MNRRVDVHEWGAMLADAERAGKAGAEIFDPGYWQRHGRLLGSGSGRGAVWFVHADAAVWVLRRYRRGGLVGRFVSDRYVHTGLRRSRPWREFTLLAHLAGMGLPVPPPVAARVVRDGIWNRGDLITEKVPGRPLSHIIAERPLEAAEWEAVGRVIRRFHEAGVWHADLNAHNILLDHPLRVWIIDFDRGRLRRGIGWRKDNLNRLARSFAKLLGERWTEPEWREGWQALERAYRIG